MDELLSLPSSVFGNQQNISSWLNYHAEPASSSWRDKLALRGLRETTTNVKRASLKSKFQLHEASCMAIHNEKNFIAHGTSVPQDNEIQLVRAMNTLTEDGVDYKIPKRFKVQGPVYDMCWHKDKLLVGSNGGQAYLYHFEPDKLNKISAQNEFTKSFVVDESAEPVAVFTHPKLKNISATPSPEQWTTNTRISCVDINENHKDVFLTLENHRVHVWAFNNSKNPIHSIKGSNGPLLCAKWNPHSTFELMFGGVSKAVKLLDYRQMNAESASNLVAWKREEAHSDAIRDLQWNPLIPYWLATCSNDGLVKIWDTRYNADPVMVLQGHDNIVRKVSWSRYHCEILASGGIDQQVKLWCLKIEPHHLLTTISKPFSDSIVGVEFSRNSTKPLQNQCFALSSSGEFVTTTLTPKFLEPLVFSRFSSDEQEEKNAEKCIYIRHFVNAYKIVTDLATKYKKENKLDNAIRILELVKEKKVSTSSKSGDPKVRFKKELSDYSYYIPPNFEHIKNDQIKSDQSKQVENLILNCHILLYVQRNQFKEVVSLEQKITGLLKQDINCFEISTIQDVINLYLANDYQRGMSLLIEIACIFFEKNSFTLFEGMSRTILSPTIYEVSQNPTLQESAYRSLATILSKPGNIISQLKLQRDVICSLWQNDSANKIVSIIEHGEIRDKVAQNNPTYLELISISVIRSYLNALLCLNKLDTFFIVATEILEKYDGYDFANTLRDLMEDVGVVKLNQLVTSKLSMIDQSVDEKDIMLFFKNGKLAITVVFNIGLHCKVPDFLHEKMSKYLDQIDKTLTFCFKRLKETKQGEYEINRFSKELKKEIAEGSHYATSTTAESEEGESQYSLAVQKIMKTRLVID